MSALGVNGSSTSLDVEAAPTDRRRGGWITALLISASVFGLTVASGSWSANLIVFLINEYNIKSIDAAQINNIIFGSVNFFPLVAAVVADSLLGCFSVIWISSVISLLGVLLLLLSVSIDGLKPPTCQQAAVLINLCASPSTTQYAVLYSAISLATLGNGCIRYTLATMGANQFTKIKHQTSFFNWFFFTFYAAAFVSSTAIVYVEDNLGWVWGFGIGLAANVAALALFLVGAPYYTHDKPHASPFTALLQVVVAAVRKRKAIISSQAANYYYGDHHGVKDAPTNWFRWLNRAALKTEGANGSVATPWKLSTVQQVEDLKSLLRILSLWSSSIFLATPIGIQASLTVLQALAANRQITRSFQFSAGSILVFNFISTAIGVVLIDHCIMPMWKKATAKNLTPLQQIGVGHVFNFTSMAVAALVESRRRSSAAASGHVISVMWLAPQMIIVGFGEAFHVPGQVGLYYQEFPAGLKSMSTAMVAMLAGVAWYLATAVVDFIRRTTDWLPNDIDKGRVDNVYWVMVVIGVINFGYFLAMSCAYTYRNVQPTIKDQIVSDDEK